MKGSGWVIIGVLTIAVLFFIVTAFGLTAFGYRVKEQKIVFGETEILRVKNTLLLGEKSLDKTWLFSSAQSIFFAGGRGFGKEFWYKTDKDKRDISGIPTNDEIKIYLETLFVTEYKPQGYGSSIDVDGIGLKILKVTPEIALESDKIIIKISQLLKSFAGLERTPTTEVSRQTDFVYPVRVQFKNLITAATNFVNLLKQFSAPRYDSQASQYIDNSVNALKGEFNKVSVNGIKLGEFSKNSASLIVPTASEAAILSPLNGLIFHYDITVSFVDDSKLENQYYFYNEQQKTLEKKPFYLTVKAEDYLVALDCRADNGLHVYSTENDLACQLGKIYSCNIPVPGIGTNLLSCVNGAGQGIGSFGCGEQGFKTNSAVDETKCYCTAFSGNWVGGEQWTCPRQVTQESAEPISGWSCTPIIDIDLIVTGYRCTTIFHDPKSCPKMECDLNGRFCTPNRC